MKLKNFILLMIIWGVCLPAFSQTIRFMGVVEDSLENAVELANAYAISQETGDVASFGVTDHLGRFILKLEDGQSYQLKVTFIGYEPFETVIEAHENVDDPFSVTLKTSVTQLGAIEVVEEFPVTISGDTIIYKADAFTKGDERKLEDVLESIPGFDVDENGEVRVQGKRVEKVLVEGKEFFEGDTKMATQNIPANAVDKVQLLRNFNEVSPLAGLGNNDDRLALNIQLTEDKKNLLFGDLEAGVGPQDRYLGHANLFYFNPKTTLNFIGDANNIGRQAFTAMDMFRFNGGFAGLSGRSGSGFTVSSDQFGSLGMQANNARRLNTSVGAFSFDHHPSEKWKYSGFLIGNRNQNQIAIQSDRTYINTEGNNREFVENEEELTNLSGLGRFKTVYSPNDAFYFSTQTFMKGSVLDVDTRRLSNLFGSVNQIDSRTDQSPFEFTQNLSTYYSIGDRHITSLEASYQYTDQDPMMIIDSEATLFDGIIPFHAVEPLIFNQRERVKSHQLEAVVNWYIILNKTNHLNFSFGNSLADQTMTTSLVQELNESLNASSFSNDVDFRLLDNYAGLSFRSKLGDFVLEPGVNIHRFVVNQTQLDIKESSNIWRALPEFTASYDLNSAETIRFQYRQQINFFDVQQVARGLRVQNYNNLFRGATGLENSLSHSLDLSYTNFSMFSHLNLFAFANYQRRIEDLSQQLTYEGLQRISVPINLTGANEFLTMMTQVTKTFEKWRITGSANLNYNALGNVIDEIQNRNTTWTQRYEGSIETRLFKILTLDVGYTQEISAYNSDFTENTFINSNPNLEIGIKILPDLQLRTEYNLNRYADRELDAVNTYELLDASLVYQKQESSWQWALSGSNLTGTEAIRRNSFSSSLVSDYAYFILPRYFTLSLKYEI